MADHSAVARRMWRTLEPLHAVTYFAPEATAAFKAVGLRGFWMGYFAGRAAPMGEVSAAVVGATFYNFSPRMVERAIPDAWGFARPDDILAARLSGVGRSLGTLLGPAAHSNDVRQAAALARSALEGLVVAGRPLAAANLSLAPPADPLLALWHAATVLREHRGDGHLSALVEAELDGCEAHVSFAGTGAVPRAVLQSSRGWTDEEWEAATTSLARRGLIGSDGRLSEDGRQLRAGIEAATDRLAAEPWRRLGTRATERLRQLVSPLSRIITDSGVIPSLNPMGARPPEP